MSFEQRLDAEELHWCFFYNLALFLACLSTYGDMPASIVMQTACRLHARLVE